MNAQDRRRARRAAERDALKKGTATADTTSTLALVERDLAPGEVLEDAAVDLPDTVEVGPVLSPERAALMLVTNALDVEEEPTPERAALAAVEEALTPRGHEVTIGPDADADFTVALDPPEYLTFAPTATSVEEFVSGVTLNGEPIEATGNLANSIRLSFKDFNIQMPTAEMQLPYIQPSEFDVDAAITPPAAPITADGLRWTASFAPEGKLTDDYRAIAPGALTWRELPLTLMAMVETTEQGHDGALVAGRIDRIWRDADGMIRGEGVFDVDGEFGAEIARMVDDRTLRGVSIDMAIHSYETGPRSDFFDEDGDWSPSEASQADAEEPSLLDLLFGEESDEPVVFVITDAVIGAVTVCPFPAFADTKIEMAASLRAGANPVVWTVQQQGGFTIIPFQAPDTPGEELGEAFIDGFTAAAAGLAPVRPPAAWFQDPHLEELTPLTVDDDGRVFGHAWAWDTCHIGIPGVCTTAPYSQTAYAHYLLKEVETDEGGRVAVGTITLDTGHADKRLNVAAATAHYDDTGVAVADVTFGEDEFGGWFAGALRPDCDAEKARTLRGAALSGDWRNVDGNLELVALLAVNVPGFPVPRTRALVADGEVIAMTAAGILIDVDMLPEGVTDADLARIEALRDAATGTFADLAARVRG